MEYHLKPDSNESTRKETTHHNNSVQSLTHTHHMGTFTPHRGIHHFISIQRGMKHSSHGHPHPTQGHTSSHLSLERNDRPISWAHPTHGLSHSSTQLSLRGERVLEDVSQSCNHQHIEAIGGDYQAPTLESFCDSLIREKDKLMQLSVINIVGTCPMKIHLSSACQLV
jgi:hypothetical protein